MSEPHSDGLSENLSTPDKSKLVQNLTPQYVLHHPARHEDVRHVEQVLVDDFATDLLPALSPVQVQRPGGGFNIEYRLGKGRYQIDVPDKDPVRMQIYHPNKTGNMTVSITQGDPHSPRRYEGHFFYKGMTMQPDAALGQFRSHWGAQVPEYISRAKLRDYLFGDLPDDSVLYQCDVRTKLPDGTRGQLRGGFVQEAGFRYADSVLKMTKNKYQISAIFDTLSGSGTMSDYYAEFQESKKLVHERFPEMDDNEVLTTAAKRMRPYEEWGFSNFKVVEFPEEAGPLVLIAASK